MSTKVLYLLPLSKLKRMVREKNKQLSIMTSPNCTQSSKDMSRQMRVKHMVTIKGCNLSLRYFAKNDMIYRPIGAFFIYIVNLKVIHWPFFGLNALLGLKAIVV